MRSVTKKLIVGYLSNVFSFALIVTAIGILLAIAREMNNEEIINPGIEYTIYTSLSVETMDTGAVCANDGYIIREHEGRIGVFYINDPYPVEIIEKYVSGMSPDIKHKLKRGITVNGMDEVETVLEKILK